MINFYPKGHPMNELKEIDASLFGHLKNDDIMPITKRRKILRRLERKKERILCQQKEIYMEPLPSSSKSKLGSLWDVKDVTVRVKEPQSDRFITMKFKFYVNACIKVRNYYFLSIFRLFTGTKNQTMYTIKDDKIVRLERERQDEFRAVDIVVPQNRAEEQLLEGTKMSLEDIKSIERFKDYKPGIPSKVKKLKKISYCFRDY